MYRFKIIHNRQEKLQDKNGGTLSKKKGRGSKRETDTEVLRSQHVTKGWEFLPYKILVLYVPKSVLYTRVLEIISG